MTEPARRTSRLDPDRLAALEDERDFLLRSLDDLDAERHAGDLDDADYEALRADYTRRAADVLRAISAQEAALSQVARRGPRSAFTWVLGLAVLGALAGWAIGQSTGGRGDADSLTGGARQSVAARLTQAQALLGEPDRWDDAIDLYDGIVAEQPGNVEAITYRAWLRYRSGADVEPLLVEWAEVAGIDAGYEPAIVFEAIALSDLGRYEQAALVLDRLPADGLDPGVEALLNSSGLVGRVYGEASYALVDTSPRPELDDLGMDADRALEAAGYLLTTDKPDRVVAALKIYDAVLGARPGDPAALSRRALLLAQAASGDPDLVGSALALVDRAVAANPDDLEALVSRATLYASVDPAVACSDVARAEELLEGRSAPAGLAEQARSIAETLDC